MAPVKPKLSTPPTPTTVREVAALAKVSLMTVSNVVNGKLSSVGPETRTRVENAIQTLGYRPQHNGRGLRLAKRLSVGMLIVDDSPSFLADPYTTQLVAGLSNYLSEHGYSLTVQGIGPSRFADALAVRNIGTDGLCVLSSGSPATRRAFCKILQSLHQPVILFQEHIAVEPREFCRILQDDCAGAALLAEHVIDQGARKLAMLDTARQWPALSERKRGFRLGVRRANKKATLARIVCATSSLVDTQTALATHIDQYGLPDGILAGNDQMGIAAIKLLENRNIKVPRQVLVTGFNGFEFRHYSTTVLTTIRSPAYEMGTRGGEEMVHRLTSGSFQERELLLPVAFERGSST